MENTAGSGQQTAGRNLELPNPQLQIAPARLALPVRLG